MRRDLWLIFVGALYVNEPLDDKPLRICVIGGGASGLAAVKIIKDTQQFKSGTWKVDAYEQRDDIGGIWYVHKYNISGRCLMTVKLLVYEQVPCTSNGRPSHNAFI